MFNHSVMHLRCGLRFVCTKIIRPNESSKAFLHIHHRNGRSVLPCPYYVWKTPPWQALRWCYTGHTHGATVLRNGDHNRKPDQMQNKHVTSLDMMKSMKNYVWPADNPTIKRRVVGSLGLLVTAKCLNTYVPILFKDVINLLGKADSVEEASSVMEGMPAVLQQLLNPSVLATGSPLEVLGVCATSLVVGYGIARAGAAGFSVLSNAVFAKVAQHSIRRIALNVFGHLHNLDLAFHLNRQTGALSKVRAFGRVTHNGAIVLSSLYSAW